MLNESTRYDELPATTIIGPDDPQPPAAVTKQTAKDLAKLADERMDGTEPAPAKQARKAGKAKPAKDTATEPLYAVLNMEEDTYRFVNTADLPAVARQIEGQNHQILYRLVPLKVSINVEITE